MPREELAAALRFSAFALLLGSWTTALIVVSWVVLLLPRAAILAVVRLWVAGVIGMLGLLGVHKQISGLENLPRADNPPKTDFGGGYLLAAAHQSVWETIVLLAILHDPRYLLKRSLLAIPLFGLYLLKLRMIAINRNHPTAALQKLLKAADTSRPLVIFPTGTRTHPDRPLTTLKSGVWAIYGRLGVAVVPCVLNSGRFWPPRRWRLYPGTIRLRFLKPIPPGLDRTRFTARLTKALNRKP